MPGAKDMTGARAGRLEVLCRAGSNRQRKALWRCRCECGAVVTVQGSLLREGQTLSCGCLQRERSAAGAGSARGLEHVRRLGRPVWRRVCRGCGAEFTGTAMRRYCERCRPRRG